MQSCTIDRPYTLGQLADYVNTCLITGYAHFLIPIASNENTEGQQENAQQVRIWFRNVFKPLLLHLMQSRAIRSLRIESEFLSPQILELLSHWIQLNQPQFKDFHIIGFKPPSYYAVYRLSLRALYINYYEKAMVSPYIALMGNSYLEDFTFYYQHNDDYELDISECEFAPHMDNIPAVRRVNIFDFNWEIFEDVNDENHVPPTHEQFPDMDEDETPDDFAGTYLIEYNRTDKRYESRHDDFGEILRSHPSLQHINLYSHPENDDIGNLHVFDKLLLKKNLRSLHLLKVDDNGIQYIHNMCSRRTRIRGIQPLVIHFYKSLNDVEVMHY
jgi:hypothetical protein